MPRKQIAFDLDTKVLKRTVTIYSKSSNPIISQKF